MSLILLSEDGVSLLIYPLKKLSISSSTAKVIEMVLPRIFELSKTILDILTSALEDMIFFAAFFSFLPLGFITLYSDSRTIDRASPL